MIDPPSAAEIAPSDPTHIPATIAITSVAITCQRSIARTGALERKFAIVKGIPTPPANLGRTGIRCRIAPSQGFDATGPIGSGPNQSSIAGIDALRQTGALSRTGTTEESLNAASKRVPDW